MTAMDNREVSAWINANRSWLVKWLVDPVLLPARNRKPQWFVNTSKLSPSVEIGGNIDQIKREMAADVKERMEGNMIAQLVFGQKEVSASHTFGKDHYISGFIEQARRQPIKKDRVKILTTSWMVEPSIEMDFDGFICRFRRNVWRLEIL